MWSSVYLMITFKEEIKMENQKNKKDWKYYLGMTLFIYCWIPYIVSGAVLFFNIPMGKLIGIMAAFIASSEISFAISVVLLGKPFIQMLKAKLKGKLFRHKAPGPEKPISKTRHYIGIILLILSFIPCFVVEISLFFGYPKTEGGHVVMYLGVIAGYTIFIVSLFILGGDFWDRLKELFQYPGKSPVPVEKS
jgi:hypothetical protein